MNDHIMTLAEIGAKFQETRVHRGVLVEDVAKSLKISSKILRAIEDGDREALPQLVFLRGFIKSYGMFLGFSTVDLQKVLAHLEETEPKPELAPRAVEKSTYMSDTPYVSKKALRKRAIIIAIIAICVLAFSYFMYTFLFTPIEVTEKEEVKIENTTTPINEEAKALANSIQSTLTKIGAEDQISTAIEVQNKREQEALDALTAEVANKIAMEAAAEANTATDITETTADTTDTTKAEVNASNTTSDSVPKFVDDDELAKIEEENSSQYNRVATFGSGWRNLLISASDECWISFELDYGAPREVYLAEGDEVYVRFETEARLRVGNAGGINVTYNGQDLGAPGRAGQVRRLVYPYR